MGKFFSNTGKVCVHEKNIFNIISDSPVTQFRNKSIFWLMKSFAQDNNVELKWIYLEVGHGKGVADGVGATAKRGISDLMLSIPDTPIYTVEDLMKNNLQDFMPSIAIYQHSKEDIDFIGNSIPKTLVAAPDTLKIHEVCVSLKFKEFST